MLVSHAEALPRPTPAASGDGREEASVWQRGLLRGVDAGLAAILLAVPFAMGGRLAVGHLLLVALIFGTATCWCLHQSLARRGTWRPCAAHWILLAAVGWVALQLVPLPANVLQSLSPRVYELLPLWSPGGEAGTRLGLWTTLSLAPGATREGMILLVACCLLFVVTVQRIRCLEDVQRLLRWVAIAVAAMAAFGLVQFLATNGKFFWFYEYPFSSPRDYAKGAFTNKNHFAHFIALGIGAVVWWALPWKKADGRRRHRSFQFDTTGGPHHLADSLKLLVVPLCLFAVLLSLSRGGTMALFCGSLVTAAVFYRAGVLRGKALLGLAGVGSLVVAGLCLYGYDMVAGRMGDFTSINKLDGSGFRRQLWAADVHAIADFPLTGTGLGSHRDVYPIYLNQQNAVRDLEFTHAENGYIQVAMETGLVGLLMVLAAIALVGYWCLATLLAARSPPVTLAAAAIAAALVVSVVHSAVDFVWYVPGCMVVVVILSASACRLWQITQESAGRRLRCPALPQAVWAVGALATVALGLVMVADRFNATRAEHYWHRYLILAQQSARAQGDEQIRARRQMLAQLAQALRFRPDWAPAHAHAADLCLETFELSQLEAENSFDTRHIRDAAVASHFASSQALYRWLDRAIGKPWRWLPAALAHAHQAVADRPLLGGAYVDLAELSFLEGPRSPGKRAYVDQAYRVRPHDGAVLYAAGDEAILGGRSEEGVNFWKASFRCGRTHQQRLLKRLAGQMPAALLIETFQPDRDALRLMKNVYRKLPDTSELPLVLAHFAAASEASARKSQGQPAFASWMDAAGAYRAIGQTDRSIACLRRAVHVEPTSYAARKQLGRALFQSGRFAEAKKHLQWCVQRNEEDQATRRILEDAVRKEVAGLDAPPDRWR